jgi:hypothetical protein
MAGRGGKGGSHKEGAPNVEPGRQSPAAVAWAKPPAKPLYEVTAPPALGADKKEFIHWAIQEADKAYRALIASIDHRNTTSIKAVSTLLGFIQRMGAEHLKTSVQVGTDMAKSGELTEEQLRQIVADISTDPADEDDQE